MGKTFQDQLLALGLVDKKKVQTSKQEKHRQKKEKKGGHPPVVDENQILAQQAREKKKAWAQKANLEREEKLKKRAEEGRIRQLIEQHQVSGDDRGIGYRFNADGKIQRLFVDTETAERLSSGALGIIGFDNSFAILPKVVVQKILEINDKVFVSLHQTATRNADDVNDPYSEYKIPDDLMW
jgi:uncharacterized protein YaiL (DUF2058 family)